MIRLFKRQPDYVVFPEDPYLRRWHLIPRNRWFNIYLHHFLRSDDERALHDHPWWSLSLILKGGYFEVLPENGIKIYRAGKVVFRKAEHTHRVELFNNLSEPSLVDGCALGYKKLPAWTLFITGPKIREWGFHCPHGWRHWAEFTNPLDGGATIGRGCD
jgi:hypothetical protein